MKIPFNFFFVFDPDRGYSASFGGILTLTSGGRARMLGVGNVVFDEFGNVIVREDHFQLKPIGN